MEHGRFDYSPIADREPLRFPDGARVAVWVIPNIEHFHWDKPSTSVTAVTAHLKPDVLNYSWRDFGVRVGIWRMMEVMERHGVKGTVALNSEVCGQYPRIVEAGNDLGWEWMAHGSTNSVLFNDQSEEEERGIIRDIVSTISDSTGAAPKGWLSPALSESFNTPDILAENGIEYVCNWVNDEQPYAMNVRTGSLISVPYSIEINDIPAFLDRGAGRGRVLPDDRRPVRRALRGRRRLRTGHGNMPAPVPDRPCPSGPSISTRRSTTSRGARKCG